MRTRGRTLLTLLGAATGVSVFVTFASISQHLRGQAAAVVQSYGIDVVVQKKGAVTPLVSRVRQQDWRALADLEGVASVEPLVLGIGKAGWNPYLLVMGMSEKAATRFRVVQGERFRGSEPQAMIGELAARRAGIGPGDEVVLSDGSRFVISGTFVGGGRMVDAALVMEMERAQKVLDRGTQINLAILQVARGTEASAVIREVEHGFPRLRATERDAFLSQVELFRTVETFTMVISVVSFAACCFVVANALLMSVTERTREFGILMAVGWSRARIAGAVVWESVVLCVTAGLVGNGVALGLLWTLNRSRSVGLGWIPVSISWEVFFGSLFVSVVLGCLSALYPAVVSSTMTPAQALRWE